MRRTVNRRRAAFAGWLRKGTLVAAFTAAVVVPSAGLAAEGGDKAKESGVIDLGELEIEGKISKPQVFYVLGRAEFRYRGLQLDQSFVDRIVASARKNPF